MLGKKAYTKPYLRTIWQNTSNFAQQMNGENVHISSFILVLKSVFGEENVEEDYSPSNNKDIIDIVIYSSRGFLKYFLQKVRTVLGLLHLGLPNKIRQISLPYFIGRSFRNLIFKDLDRSKTQDCQTTTVDDILRRSLSGPPIG